MEHREVDHYSWRAGAVDHDYYVRYLDYANQSAIVRATERLILERLAPLEGGRFLEVGCGTGDDARALARRVGPAGAVVAVDSSPEMIAEARRRAEGTDSPIEFRLGDGARLDLPDASFDGCRTERVLQHVDDPHAVVAEMVRVARQGGRIVCCEPDWETLLVDAPDRATTRAILTLRGDRQRQPWIGRQLSGLFLQAGLVDVAVEPLPTLFRRLEVADNVFRLRVFAQRAVDGGLASAEAAAAWVRSLEEADAAGRFLAAITAFLVSGRKP